MHPEQIGLFHRQELSTYYVPGPLKQLYMCFPSHQLLLKIYLNLLSPTGCPSFLERFAGPLRPGPIHFPRSMPGPCSLHHTCRIAKLFAFVHIDALHKDCGSLFPPLLSEL